MLWSKSATQTGANQPCYLALNYTLDPEEQSKELTLEMNEIGKTMRFCVRALLT
jgi:hypothetical protein